MIQITFLICSLASTALAWAPPSHPAPSKLPKAMEFAEKAWKFPKVDPNDDAAVALNTNKHLETRRYPWSQTTEDAAEESLACMEDGDHFFFDGHTSVSLRWPTKAAFLSSLPKPVHMTVDLPQEEEEDCEDHYYDESGDVLCWATMGAALASTVQPVVEVPAIEEEDECEHSFFDRMGGDELCWATLMNVAETIDATKKMTEVMSTTHAGHEEFDEDCESHFYDESGDVLCWSI